MVNFTSATECFNQAYCNYTSGAIKNWMHLQSYLSVKITFNLNPELVFWYCAQFEVVDAWLTNCLKVQWSGHKSEVSLF